MRTRKVNQAHHGYVGILVILSAVSLLELNTGALVAANTSELVEVDVVMAIVVELGKKLAPSTIIPSDQTINRNFGILVYRKMLETNRKKVSRT
jgi:hypothetical protein